MRVLISGATGLVGQALIPALADAGHQPVRLRRTTAGPANGDGGPNWAPHQRQIDADALDGVDAVVHLAGEPISSSRWTERQKARIIDSRIDGTSTLADAVAAASSPPPIFLSGSAIGFYGDRADERLDESSGPGSDFAADVCRKWEEATAPISTDRVRVVHLRTGIVLSAHGGALAEQLPFFRLGLGGRIGTGKQWFSWISITDQVGAILHLLNHDVSGPVNLTAPHPVTNLEFTKTLGRVLRRPTLIPIPKLALWAKLGRELSKTLLEGGAHVSPTKLLDSGYRFAHPDVESALRAELGRPG